VELTARGWDVWFYEDLPYALRPNALASRLAEIAETDKFEPAAEIPAGPGWERKLDAILSYPSQLETVFRQYVGVGTTRDEIGAALTEFASDAGTRAPVERFWRVSTVVGQINS
jgi:hypothetical protein